MAYINLHMEQRITELSKTWSAILLTGSQVFSLMKSVRESLAVRVALLHMSPLSQREIVGANPRPFTTDFEALATESKTIKPLATLEMYERIWNGCMPGMLSGAYTNRNMCYSSCLSTYIERDVRELSGAIDALKFAKFITAVAARAAEATSLQFQYASIDIPLGSCLRA